MTNGLTMSQAIQVHGLQKSYKNLPVLKGVDFKVEKGNIFALLGSNGAGKTTIVKILTTLLKQDGGTAAVNEILTGRENLIMIARLRHLENPRQVTDDLLNRFGLTDAADRRVSTYSVGASGLCLWLMSLRWGPINTKQLNDCRH